MLSAEYNSGIYLYSDASEYNETYGGFEIGNLKNVDIFCSAHTASTVRININFKITESFTGKRYYATDNAVITTPNGGPNYLPGTIDGTVDRGGLYV